MRFRTMSILIVIMGLALLGCDPVSKPDLVVPTLQATGPATINAEGRVILPIRVVVGNQGDAAAGRFKVAAEYTRSAGTFAVAFTVPGHDIWYPYVSSLAAAGARELRGSLTFHPAARGETVLLRVIADSCSGDEFMPTYCRVDESNESNNASRTVSVSLP